MIGADGEAADWFLIVIVVLDIRKEELMLEQLGVCFEVARNDGR